MKHTIKSNESPISADDLLQIETTENGIDVTTYGPRGGIHGFIVLDRDEFKNLLENMLWDTTLYSHDERKFVGRTLFSRRIEMRRERERD